MDNLKKQLWFDARDLLSNETHLIAAAIQHDFDSIVVNKPQLEELKVSERIKRVVMISSIDDLNSLSNEDADVVLIRDEKLLDLALSSQFEVAFFYNVVDRETLEKSCTINNSVDYLIIEFKDPTNIPLELVLAQLQQTSVQVLKMVETSEEAIIAAGVMEVGSDGFLMHTKEPSEIVKIAEYILEAGKGKIQLKEAEIIGITHLGMGERSCIDTTSLLKEDEAIVVGSTSLGGLLVCAEVHPLPYMNTRPFRVNAGAVHSYIWGPNSVVEYLTDLKAGSRVLAVNTSGDSRTVNVGRIKTEVRPLLLIEAVVGDIKINTIVQDDWHMRVFSPKSEVINVTNLKPGEKVLAHICESGRHVGIKINETITEK